MSEGPTAADFRDVLDDEYWHDRPPASLEDVMALYGVLGVAESGGGSTRPPVNSIHSSTTAGSSRFHST